MVVEARFARCRECERNGTVGFSGPPECTLQRVPEPNGSCAHFTPAGPDRPAAVSLCATEVLQAPGAPDSPPKGERRMARKKAGPPVAPAPRQFEIGQELQGVEGTLTIVKDRVDYLVKMPSGRLVWLSYPGIQKLLVAPAAESSAEATSGASG